MVIYSLGIPVMFYFLLWRVKDRLYDRTTKAMLGFLYNGYEEDCYYWEVLTMGRKVLLVMAANGPENFRHARAFRLLVIGMFSLAFHYLVQPFDDREFRVLDRVESMGLTAFVCLPLARLILDIEIPNDDEKTWGPFIVAVVFAVNISYLCLVAWAFFARGISNWLEDRRAKLEAVGEDPTPRGALALLERCLNQGQIEVTKDGTINMRQLSPFEKDNVLSVLAHAISEVADDLDHFCYDIFPLFLQVVAAQLVRGRLAGTEQAGKASEEDPVETPSSMMSRLRTSITHKLKSPQDTKGGHEPRGLLSEAREAVCYLQRQAEACELPTFPVNDFYDLFFNIIEEVKAGQILLPEPAALLASASTAATAEQSSGTSEDAWSWTPPKQQEEVMEQAYAECVDVGTQATHAKVHSVDASTQSRHLSRDAEVQVAEERLSCSTSIGSDEGRGHKQARLRNPPSLPTPGQALPDVSARLGQGFDSIAAFFSPDPVDRANEDSSPTPHDDFGDNTAGTGDGTARSSSTAVPTNTSAAATPAQSQWSRQLVQELSPESPEEEHPQQPAVQPVAAASVVAMQALSSKSQNKEQWQPGNATPVSSTATGPVNPTSQLAKIGLYEEMPAPIYQNNPLGKYAPTPPPPSPKNLSPRVMNRLSDASLGQASMHRSISHGISVDIRTNGGGPRKHEGARLQVPRAQTPASSDYSSMVTGVTRAPGAPVKPLHPRSPRSSDLSLVASEKPAKPDMSGMTGAASLDIISSPEAAPSKKGAPTTMAELVPASRAGVGARNRLQATAESEDMQKWPSGMRTCGDVLKNSINVDMADTGATAEPILRFDWFQRLAAKASLPGTDCYDGKGQGMEHATPSGDSAAGPAAAPNNQVAGARRGVPREERCCNPGF